MRCFPSPTPALALLTTLALTVVDSACTFDLERGLELEPGDVAGRVVDETGAPAAFARVEVLGAGRLLHASSGGEFHLRGLPEGAWSLRVTVDDDGDGLPERAARRSFAITTTAHADGLFGESEPRRTFVMLGDVTAGPAVEVRGRVEREGVPWGGATVIASGEEGGVTLPRAFTGGTDDDGDFRLVLPAAPFGITAFAAREGSELASQTVSIDPNPGAVYGPGGIGLEIFELVPVDALQPVELAFTPLQPGGTLVVSGRRLLPDTEELAPVSAPADASPAPLTVPTGSLELVVRDEEGGEATLHAQGVAPAAAPVTIGALDLSRAPCAPGDDCDGDGARSLPDPADPDNAALYAACADDCADAWGTGNAGATCEEAGETYDCDDDGDGQPEPYEPADCVGVGRGGDADGDGVCDSEDLFPYCAADDPLALSCEANAPTPDRPGPWSGWTDAVVDGGPGDAGADGGNVDAGFDAGFDGGLDAGLDAGAGVDGGVDAGLDSGVDAGLDAGWDAGLLDAGLDSGAGVDGGACLGPLAVSSAPDVSFAAIPVERSYLYDVAVGPGQNVYVVGDVSEETLTLGHPGKQCTPAYTSTSTSFVASFDATGGCNWARPLEGFGGVWRLDVGPNGVLVMSVDFTTSFDHLGVSLTSNNTSRTAAFLRLTSDGDAIDGLAIENGDTSSTDDFVVLPDGAIAVLGSFGADTTFGAGEPNETTLLVPMGASRVHFVAVYECDLSLRWATALGTGGRMSALAAADVGMAGEWFFATGDASLDTFVGTSVELHAASADSALIAIDETGAPRWAALQQGLRGGIEVAVNPAGTVVGVAGRGAPVDVYAAGVSSASWDGGVAGAPALTLTENTGFGGATTALYAATTGAALGGVVISGDFAFANGLAFVDDTTLAMGGNTFDFAQGPLSGVDGGVRRDLVEPQGGYVATVDITTPSAPTTVSLRVADSSTDLWFEEGALDVFEDGSVIIGGYESRTGRHDGVAGLFSGETDRAWLWRSRDGDEALGAELNDAGPCGAVGNPLAGDVLVEVIRDAAAFEARFSYSIDGEEIDFSSVNVPADGGPVSFAEDAFSSAGLRMIAAGGRYAHPDFGLPAAYAVSATGGNRYAPGPIVSVDAGAPAGANLTELRFEAPGCATAATSGFGALFVDADVAGNSRLRVYDSADALIAEETVTTAAGEEAFLGIVTTNASGAPVPAVFRVEVVNGEGWPANVNNDGVVLDDFKWGRARY
jgi:hypothetical protein